MDRRAYLSSLAVGAASLTAGCVGARVDESTPATRPSSPTPGARLDDVELPVPESELVAAVHSVIPAIVEPAFAEDWSEVELDVGSESYAPRLQPSTPVLAIERHGVARAYPLGILEQHEVVNDTLPATPGPEPLLVTYCPSCGSSMTAIRVVNGNATRFEVSHFLWRSNLVLLDGTTQSLWSQLLAGAIRGPATGEQLTLVPSTLERWGAWREAHPDTRVLLPPPYSKSLYDVAGDGYEYNRYTESAPVIGDAAGGGSADRTLVIGIVADGEATAYPFETVATAGVVNDRVGDTPVVVAISSGDSLVAYFREFDGETLRFRRVDDEFMAGGSTRWLIDRGYGVDGPFEGLQLRRANDVPPLFRFAWEDFHPETRIYGTGD